MIKKAIKSLGVSFGFFLGLLLILIFSFTIWGNLRESKSRKEIAPASGKYIKANDVEIFIQEIGNRELPTVLFVHGMGSWSEIWRESLDEVAKSGFHVIAIDLPPFGFSERPVVNKFSTKIQAERIIALLKEMGIGKATIVGHSFGGGPVLHAGLLEPELFRFMVFIDIAAQTKKNTEKNEMPKAIVSFLEMKRIRNSIFYSTITNPFFTKSLFELFVFDPDSITKEKVKMIQAPMKIEGTTNYLGDWLAFFITHSDESLAEDFPSKINQLTMPKLIIWGDKDEVTPLTLGDELSQSIPGSKLEVIEGVGHIPQLENTKIFNEILIKYLIQFGK